ncbi:hypothetical protein BDV11DRAFT_104872 [Aspergillus similis]
MMPNGGMICISTGLSKPGSQRELRDNVGVVIGCTDEIKDTEKSTNKIAMEIIKTESSRAVDQEKLERKAKAIWGWLRIACSTTRRTCSKTKSERSYGSIAVGGKNQRRVNAEKEEKKRRMKTKEGERETGKPEEVVMGIYSVSRFRGEIYYVAKYSPPAVV